MSEENKDREITNKDVLNQIELLWKDWVELEKSSLTAIHGSISCAKGSIQNPFKHKKDEIIEYIKMVHKMKKESVESLNSRFDVLLNRTVKILKENQID